MCFIGISGDPRWPQECRLGAHAVYIPETNGEVDKEKNLHRDQGVCVCV